MINEKQITRIHLHPDGYFITEDKQQLFTSYKMTANRKFVIVNGNLIAVSFQEDFLDWREGDKVIRWRLKEINLEEFPLKKDETNWWFERIGEF